MTFQDWHQNCSSESGDQSCSIQKFVPQPKVLTLITMDEYLQIRKPDIKKPDG